MMQREWTGKTVALFFGAFFGILAVVNAIFISFAMDSWSGLVTDNSFQASQEFNKVVAASKAKAELGWKAEVVHSSPGFQFSLTDTSGDAITDADIGLLIQRPTHDDEDRLGTALPTGDRPGHYRYSGRLAPGQWTVKMIIRSGDQLPVRLTHRLVVPEGK